MAFKRSVLYVDTGTSWYGKNKCHNGNMQSDSFEGIRGQNFSMFGNTCGCK